MMISVLKQEIKEGKWKKEKNIESFFWLHRGKGFITCPAPESIDTFYLPPHSFSTGCR